MSFTCYLLTKCIHFHRRLSNRTLLHCSPHWSLIHPKFGWHLWQLTSQVWHAQFYNATIILFFFGLKGIPSLWKINQFSSAKRNIPFWFGKYAVGNRWEKNSESNHFCNADSHFQCDNESSNYCWNVEREVIRMNTASRLKLQLLSNISGTIEQIASSFHLNV